MESCDHQIWNLMGKCFIMMPISSYLSNLPNQVICGVMWSSDLKSHWKMLFNDAHIIPFEQPTQSGNMWSHVTTTLNTKYFCPLYKHIYRYIPPYLASQLPVPGYCCEHHDVPCESTQVTTGTPPHTGWDMDPFIVISLSKKIILHPYHLTLPQSHLGWEAPLPCMQVWEHIQGTTHCAQLG